MDEVVIWKGALPIRIAYLLVGVASVVSGVALPLAVAGRHGGGDGVAVLPIAATLVAGGYWFLALSAEYVRIGPLGVQRCNPIWRTQTIPWTDIVDAAVSDDLPAFPVVETRARRVKLYGGMSLTGRPRSAASQTAEAIKERLRALPEGGSA